MDFAKLIDRFSGKKFRPIASIVVAEIMLFLFSTFLIRGIMRLQIWVISLNLAAKKFNLRMDLLERVKMKENSM